MSSNRYALSYPAVTGEVVTEGHARYCQEHGHATHKVDGVVQEHCPRCGELLDGYWAQESNRANVCNHVNVFSYPTPDGRTHTSCEEGHGDIVWVTLGQDEDDQRNEDGELQERHDF